MSKSEGEGNVSKSVPEENEEDDEDIRDFNMMLEVENKKFESTFEEKNEKILKKSKEIINLSYDIVSAIYSFVIHLEP